MSSILPLQQTPRSDCFCRSRSDSGQLFSILTVNQSNHALKFWYNIVYPGILISQLLNTVCDVDKINMDSAVWTKDIFDMQALYMYL